MNDTSPHIYPDIEVYVHGISADDAAQWVASVLGEPLEPGRGRGNVQRLRHRHNGDPVDVLIVVAASDGFTSICFEPANTPWADDLACARDAWARFQAEVRCSAGSWQTHMGESDDGWLQVTGDGVSPIRWQ